MPEFMSHSQESEHETIRLHDHQDLRSRSKENNRHRKQAQKYYRYRTVHPSWEGQKCLRWKVSWPPWSEGGYQLKYEFNRNLAQIPWIDMWINPLLYVQPSMQEDTDFPLEIPTDFWGHRCKLNVTQSTWTKRDMYRERDRNLSFVRKRQHFSARKYCKYGSKYSAIQRGQAMKVKQRLLKAASDYGDECIFQGHLGDMGCSYCHFIDRSVFDEWPVEPDPESSWCLSTGYTDIDESDCATTAPYAASESDNEDENVGQIVDAEQYPSDDDGGWEFVAPYLSCCSRHIHEEGFDVISLPSSADFDSEDGLD